MIELELLVVGGDGQSLVLTDADGERYRIPVTDELRAAVRRDRARLEERIADNLGARVELLTKPSGKGKLVIHFSNNDGFSSLIEKLNLARVLDEQYD